MSSNNLNNSTNSDNSPNSSFRLRFRMITHQSTHHKFQARISTSTTTSSTLSTMSSMCHTSTPRLVPQLMLRNSPLSIGLNQTNYSLPSQNESFCIFNDNIEMIEAPVQVVPKKPATRRTFKLTDDLDSNIKFDVTLKPSLSIRDDCLSASKTSTFCQSNSFSSRSSSCDVAKKNNFKKSFNHLESFEGEQIELPIRSSSFAREEEKTTTTSVPLNSSITFKIKNLNFCDSEPEKSKSANSPFTFIETVSTRRRMSSSPYLFDKARYFNFFLFLISP